MTSVGPALPCQVSIARAFVGPLHDLALQDIHWVIVGGESGPEARPMNPAWAMDLREQCRRAESLSSSNSGAAGARRRRDAFCRAEPGIRCRAGISHPVRRHCDILGRFRSIIYDRSGCPVDRRERPGSGHHVVTESGKAAHLKAFPWPHRFAQPVASAPLRP